MNNDEPNVNLNDPDVDREAANQNQRQLDGPTDFDSADHARNPAPSGDTADTHMEHDDGSIADSMVSDAANPYPTADDPYESPNSPEEATSAPDDIEAGVAEKQKKDRDGQDGPSYEINQGPADQNNGGSTDTHDSIMASDPTVEEDI